MCKDSPAWSRSVFYFKRKCQFEFLVDKVPRRRNRVGSTNICISYCIGFGIISPFGDDFRKSTESPICFLRNPRIDVFHIIGKVVRIFGVVMPREKIYADFVLIGPAQKYLKPIPVRSGNPRPTKRKETGIFCTRGAKRRVGVKRFIIFVPAVQAPFSKRLKIRLIPHLIINISKLISLHSTVT